MKFLNHSVFSDDFRYCQPESLARLVKNFRPVPNDSELKQFDKSHLQREDDTADSSKLTLFFIRDVANTILVGFEKTYE